MNLDELRTRHRGLFLLFAVFAPVVLAAALGAVKSNVTNATAVLVLVLFVVAMAASGDRLAGVASALSSALWFDFFLTEPYRNFTIDDPNDLEDALLLVVVGAAVTELALWGRRQQGRASRRAGYLDGVLQTAEVVASRNSTRQDLVRRVEHQIVDVLGIDRCRFVPDDDVPPRTPVIQHDGTVSRRGSSVDVEREGLPSDEEIGLAVRAAGVSHGHFLLTAASRVARPSLEQRRVAVLLADQVGTYVAESGAGGSLSDSS